MFVPSAVLLHRPCYRSPMLLREEFDVSWVEFNWIELKKMEVQSVQSAVRSDPGSGGFRIWDPISHTCVWCGVWCDIRCKAAGRWSQTKSKSRSCFSCLFGGDSISVEIGSNPMLSTWKLRLMPLICPPSTTSLFPAVGIFQKAQEHLIGLARQIE